MLYPAWVFASWEENWAAVCITLGAKNDKVKIEPSIFWLNLSKVTAIFLVASPNLVSLDVVLFIAIVYEFKLASAIRCDTGDKGFDTSIGAKFGVNPRLNEVCRIFEFFIAFWIPSGWSFCTSEKFFWVKLSLT